MTTLGRTRLADVGTYVAFGVICLFFAGPLLWLVSLSIRTSAEIYVSSINLWPNNPTLENYVAALNNPLFPTYLWNGLKLAVGGAFGAIFFAAPAAYALSRFRFRNKQLAMIGLLAVQMISPLVIMVPLYRYMDRIGLTDSHVGAMMLYIAIAAPLFTWMLKGFLDGIPRSLEEAAMIDGCTRFGAFMRVVLPLSLPGLTSAFVLNAILGWSQFIIPFILISKPNLLPIAVGIFNFQGTYSQTSTQTLAAASVISIVPAVVVFLVLQRFIIGALMSGAVKG
ncbi:carbohydrate ABC transporter permease [Chelativorans salis]|uniref:Carbohydrate ABC transporter permease n=1 Tax=Chelativorans salis TaxID=2978478 RepID=A0ABT2LU47_9HYPH|nr:carbohydrate ABC transporter permease [Chelativorans sp. EGI FJ00035]MCT7378056.1 carbohydrate ABC transporter permease [Chelativorans sp. EGI FJ00035]